MAFNGVYGKPTSPHPQATPAPKSIKVWLSAGNCNQSSPDGILPLVGSAAEVANAAGKPHLELLVQVQREKECLIGYRPRKSSWPWKGKRKPSTETDGLPSAMRLPLFHANVCHLGPSNRKPGRRRASLRKEICHTVSIAVPTAEACGSNRVLQLATVIPQPARFVGTWFFTCSSTSSLQEFLGQLQLAGCIMMNLEERYSLARVVGNGASSKVYFAEDLQTSSPVAVKVVHPSAASGGPAPLLREATILRRARHPNILQFLGVYKMDDDSNLNVTGSWAIITEFISGGELFDQVRHCGPLPEEKALYVANQVLSGITFLHERGIVHRDIKTENVILVGVDYDIKIVDFGLATPEWDSEAMSMRCGSPGYVAPEVLRGEKYGCTVDCFSIGVLLYILLSGRGPFSDRTLSMVLLKNLHCQVNPKHLAEVSEVAKDLILKMLTPNIGPNLRPSAAQCLKHPWFQKAGSIKSPVQSVPLRKDRRIYSKELRYEEIFNVETRFSGSGSHENSATPPEPVEPLTPTSSIEVLSDNTVAPPTPLDEEKIECSKCATPPLAENSGGDHAGFEDLRTVTPIWAEVQHVLANLEFQGAPGEISDYLLGASENERNDIQISFVVSQTGCPSEERTSRYFALGSDGDSFCRQTFTSDFDPSYEQTDGIFGEQELAPDSPQIPTSLERNLRGNLLKGNTEAIGAGIARRLAAGPRGMDTSNESGIQVLRLGCRQTRRLGGCPRGSSADSGMPRRLGGFGTSSAAPSREPSAVSYGGSQASELQSAHFSGSPASRAKPIRSRSSPSAKVGGFERTVGLLLKRGCSKRKDQQRLFRQMQFHDYAGCLNNVSLEPYDRVSAYFGRDVMPQPCHDTVPDRLSAFYMRDLLGGKALDNECHSEGGSNGHGRSFGDDCLLSECFPMDLPGTPNFFEQGRTNPPEASNLTRFAK